MKKKVCLRRKVVSMSKFILIPLLIFSVISGLCAGGQPDAKIIRVNTGVSAKDPAARVLVEVLKPLIEERTNGAYIIEPYSGGQLGADKEAIESLRYGTLEMNLNGTAALVGLVPELSILDLHFAFNTSERLLNVLNGDIGDMLTDKLAAQGIVVLAWTDNGLRNLTNSRGPVNVPSDLKGLKLRTQQNKFHMAAWQALGAAPTPMSISEVFTALQTHTIDGQENPIPTIYGFKFYEVNNYITLTRHVNTPCGFFFSKKIFDTLPVDIQEIFYDVAAECVDAHLKMVSDTTVEYIEAMKSEGVIINELKPENLKLFRDATSVVWDKVGDVVGHELVSQLRKQLDAMD